MKLLRYVLINHSRRKALEPFHGRSVRLFANDPHTPFHGAFIDQEMRVRGRYPYEPEFADRPIELPIQQQTWITTLQQPIQSCERDSHNNSTKESSQSPGSSSSYLPQTQFLRGQPLPPEQEQYPSPASLVATTSSGVDRGEKRAITFQNPIANPSELKAIMRSARQQPNWTATEMEGETWEGTAQ
jgi:hypothetical protein